MYEKNRKKIFIMPSVFAMATILVCGCLNQNTSFKPKNQGKFNVAKIKVHHESFENIYIEPDCLNSDCACESEICKINDKNDETAATEEGYRFNPFSTDVLEFLNQNTNVYQNDIETEAATTPARTENNNLENDNKQQQLEQDEQNDNNNNLSVDNNKKIDLSALHEMLKIKENKANITEINERIKITPKFVIITKTKSKIMMNLSVSF